MKRVPARVRGVIFITWQARHHGVHLVLGFLSFQFFSNIIDSHSSWYLLLSLVGSELPDGEHVLHWLFPGRDKYSKRVHTLLFSGEWRSAAEFVNKGHKGVYLRFHSAYTVFALVPLTYVFLNYDLRSATFLVGAMITHYIFDMADDIIFLRKLNPNWTALPITRNKRGQ